MHRLKNFKKLNKDASGGQPAPLVVTLKPFRVHVTNRFNDNESYTLGPYATTVEAIEVAKRITVNFLKEGIRKDGEDTPLELLDYFLSLGDIPQVIGSNYSMEFNTAAFAEQTCYELLGMPIPEQPIYSKMKFILGDD